MKLLRFILIATLAICPATAQTTIPLAKTTGTNVLTSTTNPLVVGSGQSLTIASGGTLTVNGTMNVTGSSNILTSSGSYANPSWLTSLDWSKITSKPTIGTVSSVGLTMPAIFSVANTPVTSSGTLAVTFATGQTANQVLASPNGSSGAVSLRALVPADIPTLTLSKISDAGTAASKAVSFFQTPQTSAAGYGITNGVAIDQWGTKTRPSGDVFASDSGNKFLATPANGSSGAPTMRAITSADIPPLTLSQFPQITSQTIIGNAHGDADVPQALTASEAKGILAINASDVSGLGNSALLDVGVTAGTVAAGDDPRFHLLFTNPGQTIYAGVGGNPTILNGNTSATMAVYTQTGTGGASAAPTWTSTTGTGNVVRATSPTLVTPDIGNATGNVSGNAGTATALATGRTISITGDLAYTSPAFTGAGNVTAAATLATITTADTTGSSTAIPVITKDAKGRVTGITTAAVVAPAGTLTGTTLASNVVNSSLTTGAAGTLVAQDGSGVTADITIPAGKTLDVSAGTLTATAGSTTTLNGTLQGTPTGGTLDLSALDLLGVGRIYPSSTYSGFGLGIGTSDPLAPIHTKVHAADTGAVSSNLSHNYYPAVFESEDAVIGLISRDEGGHGSGIDLMEVNDGVLKDKWWWGRDSSTIGQSGIEWTYGTPATYETNTQMMTMTKTGVLKFPQLGSTLSVGTYAANGTLTLAATSGTATILAKTDDGADSERISIGGGGLNTVSRGGYINLMGNEYPGQEGDVSFQAGDAISGNINFYTAGTRRGYVSKVGSLTWLNNTAATTAGDGSVVTAGGVYVTKNGVFGQNIHTLINSSGIGLVSGNMASNNYSVISESADAEIGLASNSGGTLGSGIDLMEVESGVLADKWWIGRGTSTSATPSQLYFRYGVNADYASNDDILILSKVGVAALPQSTSSLSIGTYLSTGTLTLNAAATATILTPTSDGSDNKRISIGGGGLNTNARGAYINIMGNEYSGQEGDLSLIAGNSTSGAINLYTGALVKRISVSNTGAITLGNNGTAFTSVRRTSATLVEGTVTVLDTAITANSEIYLGCKTPGGTPGACFISSKTAGTGYTITSTSALDASVVAILIFEP